MKRAWILAVVIFLTTNLACGTSASPFPNPTYTPESSVFESDQTAYGFFPSPPEVTLESVFTTFRAIGEHGDVVLFQENIPWEDFVSEVDAESKKITDMKNAQSLALGNNLDSIYVVDPLNGLNRREFAGLPKDWGAADFSTPQVRQAFLNFTLRVVREFHPRYLGLASEINTYADAFPADFSNFLSLYRETYAAIKTESPETLVFVTFQWEDLNNLGGFGEGRNPHQTNWDQIEVFEPQLDVWVISSYPFIAFPSAADIPANYYTPLLERTSKPLAVAEGGYPSHPVASIAGEPQDQVDYLQAIHTQLGERLDFWIYLLLSDFNLDSYAHEMRRQGNSEDVETLRFFSTVGLREKDGTPKPALTLWDSFNQE